MRRISRIDRPIRQLRCNSRTPLPSPYFCAACRSNATPFSTSSIRAARPNDYTDSLRRKIWGTDNPPGLENPYGEGSALDKLRESARSKKVAVEDEAEAEEASTPPPISASYEPSETWDGLEHVGGEQTWVPEHPFESFLPAEIATESEVITLAFHRALVEVFATQEAKKPLYLVSQAEPGDYLTQDVQILETEKGVRLQFPETVSLQDVIQSLSGDIDETEGKVAPTESEEDVAADRSTVDPLNPVATPEIVDETATKEAPTESEEDVAADRSSIDPLKNSSPRTYEDVIAAWDPSWLKITLQDPEIKFAVLKRTMQLTGVRIPDSSISSANTAKALLDLLLVKPKSRKLVEALIEKDDLWRLPNVSIFADRVTPIDKETTVGRWKVIKKELEERGLPVTGH